MQKRPCKAASFDNESANKNLFDEFKPQTQEKKFSVEIGREKGGKFPAVDTDKNQLFLKAG